VGTGPAIVGLTLRVLRGVSGASVVVVVVDSTIVIVGLADGPDGMLVAQVGLLRRWEGERWGRRVGGGDCPSPFFIRGEVGHGIFWEVFIQSFAFMDKGWAGGRSAGMRRAVSARDALWGSATFT